MDDLLLLIIVGAYFLMLCVLAFIAGQLMILILEYAADEIERRQSRAEQSVKTVSYSQALKHKRARCKKRYLY